MFNSFLESSEKEEKIDTIAIKAEINETVRGYLKSKIVFKNAKK